GKFLGRPTGPRSGSANRGRVDSRAQDPATGILLRPPVEQHRKARLGRGYCPVELRDKIIEPPVDQPFARIGVQLGKGVAPLDLRRILRTPNAERADAELHPGLRRLDRKMDPLDEDVYILSPPIVAA